MWNYSDDEEDIIIMAGLRTNIFCAYFPSPQAERREDKHDEVQV
jgi:hypothetical protein